MARRALGDLYAELFALDGLMHDIGVSTIFFELRRGSKEPASDAFIDKGAEALLKLVKAYGYQPEPWRAAFGNWVRAQATEAQATQPAKWNPGKAYPKPVLDRAKMLRKQIAAYPTDLNKAYALLQAHYEDRPTCIVVAHCLDAPASGGRAKPNQDAMSQLPGGPSSDPIDAFNEYRFLRAANRRSGREQREKFIAETRHDLRQLVVNLGDLAPSIHYMPCTIPQLIFIWLCSREPSLRGPLFSVGRQLAHQLLRWQLANGSCAMIRELPEPPRSLVVTSSALLTALVINVALVFGDPDVVEPLVSRGISWLAANQLGDGGWLWRDDDDEPDLITALAAIEVMKRFSAEENAIQLGRAEEWVMSTQDPMGGWTSRGYDQSTLLVLAIETLTAKPVPMHGIQRLLRLSREMLFKSGELLEQGETVDRQLAVIAAHHACEMFLYGYFTSISPEEAFVQPNGQTIGLTQALARLQERLILDGKLPASRTLPHGQQVQQLSTARDGIVHRGNSVSSEDARMHVEAAHRFVSAHSEHLLGASLI